MVKIVVIGPVLPFRGGIAVSNTILCENLSKNHELLVVSFSRLYPKVLYPGQFQKTKDAPSLSFKANECLDSMNPLTWQSTVKMIKEFKPDLVLFQWWTTFLSPCYCFLAGKLIGIQKAVILQNVLPHEKNQLDWFLTSQFFKRVNRFVALAEKDSLKFKSLFSKPVVTITEPDYGGIVSTKFDKKEARKKLMIKEFEQNILFFGFVRPYKNLASLLQAMKLVPNVKLYVVGEWWEKPKEYQALIDVLGNRVQVVNRYVSDEEMTLFFSACNAIVLPYSESSESGIIQLALGFNLPMITTPGIANSGLIEHEVNGLIAESEKPRDLAFSINQYFDKKLEEKFRTALRAKKGISWTMETEKKVLFGESVVVNK